MCVGGDRDICWMFSLKMGEEEHAGTGRRGDSRRCAARSHAIDLMLALAVFVILSGCASATNLPSAALPTCPLVGRHACLLDSDQVRHPHACHVSSSWDYRADPSSFASNLELKRPKCPL